MPRGRMRPRGFPGSIALIRATHTVSSLATVFLHPLGLIALAALPAVLALHLFRRRFRPRTVSALFLWDEIADAPSAGRRLERVERSVSFWCEMLFALLLALVLAGPKGCGGLEARHLVVVLDGSASMQARAEGLSSAERARTALEEAILDLPAGSRITVLQSGPRPRVIAGPAAFPEEAELRLDDYMPRAGAHDLAPTLALAAQLAGEGSVWLYTDRYEPDSLPPELGVRAFGRPLDNVAIARASRVRVESEDGTAHDRVFLTLASHAHAERTVRLAFLAAGVELDTREFVLGAGERRHLELDLPPDAPPIVVRIDPDALTLDDEVTLLPPPPRFLGLAAALSPEHARQLALTSAGANPSLISRWLELVPQSIDVGDPARAHLAIAGAPSGSPTTDCLTIECPPGERIDLVGPFLIEKRHPLLEGITLEGVVWSAARDHALDGTPIISAGNVPLLTEQRDGERVLYRANLDPARSTLQSSPDWPILLANLAEWRRADLPGPRQTNLVVGEPLVFRAEGSADYVLSGPEGERELRARGNLVVDDLGAPGVYILSRDGKTLANFSLQLADSNVSELSGRGSGRRPPPGELAEIERDSTWLAQILIAIALAVVLIDWFALSRARARAV